MSNDTQLDTLRGTILAVDDSPTIRKLVSMTMEGQGYRVVVASDGIEALAILKDEHPDLILCDVAMPKLDGYQLCKIIKNSNDSKHIPVVMLSGKDGLFDKVRGRMAGCSNYITKPFEPDLLISEVRKYVKPALIPVSPIKPKKKTPEAPKQNQATDGPEHTHKNTPEKNAQMLSDQLADLTLPAARDTSVDPQKTLSGETSQSPEPVSVRADDLPPLPETPQAEPNPKAAPLPQEMNSQNSESVSVRADDLPPLPDSSQPEPNLKPAPLTETKPKEQATLSEAAGAGTAALDKLLSELDQEDEETSAPPQEPFRSRCPGCQTVFRNVSPDNYDKHARCKKCSTRFHLGDHLVV